MFETMLERLEPFIKAQNQPEAERLDIIIDAEDLLAVVEKFKAARWGYLAAITGLDPGAETETLEVLYHFCEGAAVLTLRVTLPRETPVISGIQNLFPDAQLFEHELREMFGIEVVGLPDYGYLFLPDDWSEGVYPMRKDAVIPPPESVIPERES